MACPGAQPSQPVAPYRNLRDAKLEYHGPEEDASTSSEVRIGWFGPTAKTNQMGAEMWWAACLAVEEANAFEDSSPERTADLRDAGRAPLRFRLSPCWTADPWGGGAAQLARMVYQERPLALIGSVDSASTHLAEQIVAKANLPLISPVATDKSITLAGVAWMFSCAPSDSAVADVLVDAVMASVNTGNGRVALLTSTDHESRMTAREVLRALSRRQHPPDFSFEMAPGATEISLQLARLAQAAPTAILIIAGPEDSAKLARAVRALKTSGQAGEDFSPRLFGSQAMARHRFLQSAGSVSEEVTFPLPGLCRSSDAAAELFCRHFEAAQQHPPDYTALLAYDATRLLLEAIRKEGPQRAAVRTALASMTPWSGVGGEIRFDGTGQNTRTNVPLGTWRSGRIKLVGPCLPR